MATQLAHNGLKVPGYPHVINCAQPSSFRQDCSRYTCTWYFTKPNQKC